MLQCGAACNQYGRVQRVNTVTLHKWGGCYFKEEQRCLRLMNYLQRRSEHGVCGVRRLRAHVHSFGAAAWHVSAKNGGDA